MLLLRRILNICQKRSVDLNVVRHVAKEIAYVRITCAVIINGSLKAKALVLPLHLGKFLIIHL